jgi:hypothetical protein
LKSLLSKKLNRVLWTNVIHLEQDK